MNNNNNTRERVVAVICTKLGTKPAEAEDSANVQSDLGADSLDVVELAMGVEDEFNITIPDDDINKLKTVGDIVNYVEAKLA